MRRLVTALAGLSMVLSGTLAVARTLPNFDALAEAKPSLRSQLALKRLKQETVRGRIAHTEARLGVPTFVWAERSPGRKKQGLETYAHMRPEQAALAQLESVASVYGVASLEQAGATVERVSRNAAGTTVVTLSQRAGEAEVFRQKLNVLLDRNNEVVALSGYLTSHLEQGSTGKRFRFALSPEQAIAAAYGDLTGQQLDASLLQSHGAKKGGYQRYVKATLAAPQEQELLRPARARQVLFPMPDTLVPAYYVELNTGAVTSHDSDYYSYVIAADDGRLLFRNNLTADESFSYRVWADTQAPYTPFDGPRGTAHTPHPTATPDGSHGAYVAPNLVTLQNVPFSRNDPWLAAGATITQGNNVDAFADLERPDGYNTGDLHASTTAANAFDRIYDVNALPGATLDQRMAAVTQLFFVNNWLHDWFYDAGFDEASGNAQDDNFGRGGLDGDSMRAEAQDYRGKNNANMATPADGDRPRMQMYVFDGAPGVAELAVNAPQGIAGTYLFGPATFGQTYFAGVTGDVVAAVDSVAGGTLTDGCDYPYVNAADVVGKIVLVDRGLCGFTQKVYIAEYQGAIGVIVADNADGSPPPALGAASTDPYAPYITIPSGRITKADGATVRTALATSPVNVTMRSEPGIDGSIDNGIVAHEWGHYISNRLVGNAAGLTNNQGRSMGEGWGDFHALLMMVRPEDINVATNANWTGTYALAEYAMQGSEPESGYYGIRRVPYSVDMARNALSFRHIQNGVALPDTHPIYDFGVNAEVHNAGEVWATMLWECYVELLRAYPFADAQARMKRYLVGGYKLTPPTPTFTEARDAILAAAYAESPDDFQKFWAAFARRGMGVGAKAPDRHSTTHAGVVESTSTGGDVEFVSAELVESPTLYCDKDGVVDNGETGLLRITLRNSGNVPVSATTLDVTTATAGITLPATAIAVPAMGPVQTATVEVPVELTNVVDTNAVVTLTINYRDAAQAVPGDKTASFTTELNRDETLNGTAIETVEAQPQNTPWDATNDPALAPASWGMAEFPAFNGVFYGENVGAKADYSVVTPDLQVGTDPFVISFWHFYRFESDGVDHYDGAVVELSNDGGATWTDIGSLASSANGAAVYNGAISGCCENPLAGRMGFVQRNPGWPSANQPAWSNTVINLGTTYAGQTVKVRFRMGTDLAVGDFGWVLDDLEFQGLLNTPFTAINAEDAVCINRPLTADAGADVTGDERTEVTLTATATDADGTANHVYSWAQTGGTTQATLTATNAAALTFTLPEVVQDETLTFTVTVTDGEFTSTDSVNVLVKHVNRLPVVSAGEDVTVDERGTFTLAATATDEDTEQTLTYAWERVSGLEVSLDDAALLAPTFATPEVTADTPVTLRLTVTDSNGASVSDEVTITVHHVNRAPTATTDAARMTVGEREDVTLTAVGADLDEGDSLTYAWTQVEGDTVTLSGADTATVAFTAPNVPKQDKTLVFQVVVSDGALTSEPATVTVTVEERNRKPRIHLVGSESLSVDERSEVTLQATAEDDDAEDAPVVTWSQVSGPEVLLTNSGAETIVFMAPEVRQVDSENVVLQAIANDGVEDSEPVQVTLNVKDIPRAPTVSVADMEAVKGGDLVRLVSTTVDPEEGKLTYTWEQTGGPTVERTWGRATRSFFAPKLEADATLTFKVTVTSDVYGLVATDEVSVVVKGEPKVQAAGCSSTGSASSSLLPVALLGLAFVIRRRKLA